MFQVGPLLWTGPYRSGSTYSALLLNNHPNLALSLHLTGAPRYWNRSRDVGEFADHVWHHTHERFGEEYVPPFKELRTMSSKTAVWLRMLGRYAQIRGGAGIVGEKTNLSATFVPTFLDVFGPNRQPRAVICIRDPRSICASFREYDHHDPPVYLQSAFVALAAMQQTIHLNRERDLEEFRVVQYESIAKRPALVIRDLIRWLGLDWPGTHRMMDQSGWPDVPGSKWEDRSSFSDADSIDVDAAVNRWRGRLSDVELHFVETICSDVMGYFGYERETEANFNEDALRGLAYGDDKLQRMITRWVRTGEGTEEFPDDPTDASTWRSEVHEGIA